MIVQKLNLNLIPGRVPQPVRVNQYDHDADALEFTIYSGAEKLVIPAGGSVTIQGQKPDKTGFQYPAKFSGSTVTADLTEQMTAVAGKVTTEIKVKDGEGNELGTGNFLLMVEPAALGEDTHVSETQIPMIQKAADNVDLILQKAGEAAQSAQDAEAWANGTRGGEPVESGDETFRNNAQYHAGKAEAARTASETAQRKAETAQTAAEAAQERAEDAQAAAETAQDGAETAQLAAETAKGRAETAQAAAETARTGAQTSETNAAASETSADRYAKIAQSWAEGTGYPSREDQEENNAKEWANKARIYAERVKGRVVYVGSVTFANLPTTGMQAGDQYNVSDAFTTDARFVEGAGIPVEPGTDVTYGEDGKWNLAALPGVNTFNGRKGNVQPLADDYAIGQIKATGNEGQVPTLNEQGRLEMRDPAVTGHAIMDESGTTMEKRLNLKFEGAEVEDDAQNDQTIIKCKRGHAIEGESGAPMTQRDSMQFKGDVEVYDDGTNKKTVVNIPKPVKITWTEWNTLSDAQKSIGKWDITDVPGADGTILADLLTKLWENPSPKSAFSGQIYLSSDDYDFVIAMYSFVDGNGYGTVIAPKGKNLYFNFVRGTASIYQEVMSRIVTYISDTNFYVNDCGYGTNSSFSADNRFCVPQVIYGFKKTVTLKMNAIAMDVSTSANKCMMSKATSYSVEDMFGGRTRRNITNDLSRLSQAVSEQNLAKYGYKIGDYFIGPYSGYGYTLADMDTYYGGYDSYAAVSTHHIGIIVNVKGSIQWNTSVDVSTGYAGSNLHSHLKNGVLNNIKQDMIRLFGGSTGFEHLISHHKLLSVSLDNVQWTADQYISALTEIDVYGCTIWSANSYQIGETNKQLELFRKFRFSEIYGQASIWLRSIANASYACLSASSGICGSGAVTATLQASGLILFK